MPRLAAAALAACLAAGCERPVTPSAPAPGSLVPVEVPADHVRPSPLPDPELNGGHIGRAPRRISVAQLKQSIIVTTGRAWADLDGLAASLGQADYALTVSDSTEPNLVFAKFLEEGARKVCLETAVADLARPQAQRVLWPEVPGTGRDFTGLDDATIEANLTTLSVRFWGSRLDAGELAAWTASFRKMAERAKVAAKPEQAWGSICVALMTDPRFITY